MSKKWWRVYPVCNSNSVGHSSRCHISVGISCVCAVCSPDNDGNHYVTLTEVTNCESCSGEGSEVTCRCSEKDVQNKLKTYLIIKQAQSLRLFNY